MTSSMYPRNSARYRAALIAAAISLLIASCGQGQEATEITSPEASAFESTNPKSTDSSAANSTTSTSDPGTVPTPDTDVAPLSEPETPTEPAATEPAATEPAATEPKPQTGGPSALPNIAMTDAATGNQFSINQLNGSDGDILLWFYLPT